MLWSSERRVFMVRLIVDIYPSWLVLTVVFFVIVGWTLGWTVPIFVDTTRPCIPCSITYFFRRSSLPTLQEFDHTHLDFALPLFFLLTAALYSFHSS
jgi:hypothetical protein